MNTPAGNQSEHFHIYQSVHLGLISDGKIGAGKVRAAKIARFLNYKGGS